jgi:hypothetical protein
VFAKQEERARIEAVAAELGVPFRGVWLTAQPDQLVGRVAQRRNDASDATAEVVRRQLGWHLDPLSDTWINIDAGGTPEETLQHARAAIRLSSDPAQL